MKILKKSRKAPRPGDVFALSVKEGQYFFGRVISLDMTIGPMKNVILLYIYDVQSQSKQGIPALDKHRLLVPPLGTNRLPWSRGYFETVDHHPLTDADLLGQHCFEDRSLDGAEVLAHFDEQGKRLKRRFEPCGQWGLESFRTIDDSVSKAVGIPLAPD